MVVGVGVEGVEVEVVEEVEGMDRNQVEWGA